MRAARHRRAAPALRPLGCHRSEGAYEEHIRVHIKPYLGEVKLAKLTAPMVQNVYNTLLEEKGLSPKSVKNIHGVLHRALEQAKKLNYLRENPLDAVILPRTEKPQLQTMDDADMIAFLQAIEGDAYEIELFVDAFTGLRQGELLGLTWDCVDFEHQTLLINKQHNRAKGEKEFHFSSLKTEKVRSLTVTDEVMDALRRQQRRQAAWKAAAGELWSNPDNLVFTTEFGRYVNNKTLYMNFKRVMRSLGLSEFRFHDLRHPYVKHTTINLCKSRNPKLSRNSDSPEFLLLCTTSYSNLIDARRKIPVMIWYFPVAMLPTFFLTSLHLYEVCNNIVEHRVVKVFPREYTITYFC